MIAACLRRLFQADETNGRYPVDFTPTKWLTKSDA
jgi:hypothetical protein